MFYGYGHAEGGLDGPTDAFGALTYTVGIIENPENRSATAKAGPGSFFTSDPNDPRLVASVAFEVSC